MNLFSDKTLVMRQPSNNVFAPSPAVTLLQGDNHASIAHRTGEDNLKFHEGICLQFAIYVLYHRGTVVLQARSFGL